jgi:carboxyl-terminal processing protease
MPKRNLVLICLIAVACLLAWAARDRGGKGRLYGEVSGHVGRLALEPVDDDDLFHGAMEGMLTRLDEHSAIVTVEPGILSAAGPAEEFAGVGLELVAGERGGYPTVVTPSVGSPAWQAGIAAGDRLVAIDGISTESMRLKEVIAMLRGAAGSRVLLDVAPPEGDPEENLDEVGTLLPSRSVPIDRAVVRMETVCGDLRRADGSWEWFIEGEDGVALVRLSRFSSHTVDDLDRALSEITVSGQPAGLILDLRGNTGGTLDAAIDVCDRFLEEGVIVSLLRRPAAGTRPLPVSGENLDVRRATPGVVLGGVPIAVIVDGVTASVAEVVAACLQDHGRATVVGSRTFGKGTVQTTVPLSDGRHALRLTTAEYLRPTLSAIHRRPHDPEAGVWGVVPDRGHEIDPPGGMLEQVREWRLHRDAVPRHPAAGGFRSAPVVGTDRGGSSARLPRHVDPVLGRAVAALGSQRVLAGAGE